MDYHENPEGVHLMKVGRFTKKRCLNCGYEGREYYKARESIGWTDYCISCDSGPLATDKFEWDGIAVNAINLFLWVVIPVGATLIAFLSYCQTGEWVF